MKRLYLLIECEKPVLKCKGICDLYGSGGRDCNRSFVTPGKMLVCRGNTYYIYLPLKQLKNRRF